MAIRKFKAPPLRLTVKAESWHSQGRRCRCNNASASAAAFQRNKKTAPAKKRLKCVVLRGRQSRIRLEPVMLRLARSFKLIIQPNAAELARAIA